MVVLNSSPQSGQFTEAAGSDGVFADFLDWARKGLEVGVEDVDSILEVVVVEFGALLMGGSSCCGGGEG